MKRDIDFNWKVERCPEEMKEVLCCVNDTLDMAWASAQEVFGEDARPEHALKICELMLERIWHERDRKE